MMTVGAVYGSITEVIRELSQRGLAKNRRNSVDDYEYRSIDDVLNRLSPLLAKHRLCVLPRVVDRTAVERAGASQPLLLHVSLRVAFDLVSAEDGSRHTVEAVGEALDPTDKATAKAHSAAYKSAMIQVFCIPVAGNEDADAKGYRILQAAHLPEPLEGWEQWAEDIAEIIASCESFEAVETVQQRNLMLLKTLRKERSDLYDRLGRAFTARRDLLTQQRPAKTERKSRKRRTPHQTVSSSASVQHA